MSLTLLKQSLEILDDDSKKNTSNTNKKNDRHVLEKGKKSKRKSEMHFIKDQPAMKIKDIRNEMRQGEQKSKENLRRLLALSKNTLKDTVAQKIVKRAHKGRYEDVKLPKREMESIFSEEDFKAFEEEYFKS